jgi:hypothetical protein
LAANKRLSARNALSISGIHILRAWTQRKNAPDRGERKAGRIGKAQKLALWFLWWEFNAGARKMAKVGLVYGSVCSGISSESMAWQALGWKAAWFSQFDPDHNYKSGPDFPSAVLAHHCSHIPNLGDANEIHKRSEFKESKIDILVGGTPCQTFSQAGQRQGFNDPRGRLALRFAEIAAMRQPRWIIWENVPDVVSSNGGKDFRAFLRKLHDAGYGCSWRFLDAADFGRVSIVPNMCENGFFITILLPHGVGLSVRASPSARRSPK